MFIFYAKKSDDWEGIYYVEDKSGLTVPGSVTMKDETSPHPPYCIVPKGDLHDALLYVVQKAMTGQSSISCGEYLITVMPPDLPWAMYKVIISEI